MTATQADKTTLVETKLALARKYERLAKAAKSLPRQKKCANRAESYRRQAQMLSPRSG